MTRAKKITLGILGLCVVALAVFVMVFDWNWLRGPVERYVTEKTGRKLTIGGDITVKLGWEPVVRVGRVSFQNVEWSKDPLMGQAEALEFVPVLRTFFSDRIVVRRLRAVRPDVVLERTADGKRNWTLGKSDDPAARRTEIRSVSIDHGTVRVRDGMREISALIEVSENAGEEMKIAGKAQGAPGTAAPDHLPTRLAFSGRYRTATFQGTAITDDILTLRNSDTKFAVRAKGRVNDSNVEIDGEITDLLQLSGIDVRLKLQGPDWSRLYPIFPVPLPTSPPYLLDGRLKHSGDSYTYERFKGVIGSSDIGGSATFRGGSEQGARPHLRADFTSNVLDLRDLGPLIGVSYTPPPAAVAPPETREKTKKPAVDRSAPVRRVLPDEPFRASRLNAIDADVTLKAKQLRRPDALALEDLSAKLHLDKGVMTIDPLDFGFAGGSIVSAVKVDATRDPLATDARVAMRGVKLEHLFPTVKLMQETHGAVGGSVQLAGRGNSVADALATSSGHAGFAVTGGEISNLMVEVMGLDGAEIVKFLLGGDRKTPIRCGAASFDVKDGKGTSNFFVFDTADTKIDGEGSFDLKDESLDLTLKPHPKDRSILVLRAPIHIHGKFGRPTFAVDKQGLLKRGGAAVALGLLSPLAALVPLVETGGGENADCRQLLSEVRGATREAQQPGKPGSIAKGVPSHRK